MGTVFEAGRPAASALVVAVAIVSISFEVSKHVVFDVVRNLCGPKKGVKADTPAKARNKGKALRYFMMVALYLRGLAGRDGLMCAIRFKKDARLDDFF